MDLDLDGLIPRPLLPVEQRRIEDGKLALRLKEPKTKGEAMAQIGTLYDGARALQSLDDLGTPEANKRACEAMDWIMAKWIA